MYTVLVGVRMCRLDSTMTMSVLATMVTTSSNGMMYP